MRRPGLKADLIHAGSQANPAPSPMNAPLTHPPVSAPPLSAPPVGPPSEHQASEHQASLEHLLLRFGLITLDQLSAAMREQTETGTPFADVLVRDGILKAEDLARVADRAPALAPEPEPDPEPPPLAAEAVREDAPTAAFEPPPVPDLIAAEPVAIAPGPVFVPEPEPEPVPVASGFVVRGRLVNGEEIEIASVDDAEGAQRIARDAMRACARNDGADWPVLNGRYVRPDSIVSIEVSERF